MEKLQEENERFKQLLISKDKENRELKSNIPQQCYEIFSLNKQLQEASEKRKVLFTELSKLEQQRVNIKNIINIIINIIKINEKL